MEIKRQGYGNHVAFRTAFTAAPHMRRAVLQSAFISQVAENELVREACLVIQDLQFCSWRLEKCWPKDREYARVNIDGGMSHRCWCMTTEFPVVVIFNVLNLNWRILKWIRFATSVRSHPTVDAPDCMVARHFLDCKNDWCFQCRSLVMYWTTEDLWRSILHFPYNQNLAQLLCQLWPRFNRNNDFKDGVTASLFVYSIFLSWWSFQTCVLF